MKSFLLLFYTVLAISVGAQTLPDDVEDVLGKLKEFEIVESNRFKQKVTEKRSAVAEFLKQSLTRETKAGNLEAALAIKAKIEALDKPADLSCSATGAEEAGTVKAEIPPPIKSLVGTTWTTDSGTVEFISRDKVVALGAEYFWKEQSDKSIELAVNEKNFGVKIRITFDLESGKGILFNRLTNKEQELSVKR